jgi:methionine aminopeptidase
VGAFQLGCTLALSAFSVEQSTALAFSLVLHATQFVATVLAGVYSLTVEGLSLREIEEVSESNVAIS